MEVSVKLIDWEIKEENGMHKIAGNYALMAGATEIAKQSFNGSYNSVTVAFPTTLIVDAEAMTQKIGAELTAHFTGRRAE